MYMKTQQNKTAARREAGKSPGLRSQAWESQGDALSLHIFCLPSLLKTLCSSENDAGSLLQHLQYEFG